MKIAGHSTTSWLKLAARIAESGVDSGRRTVKKIIGRRHPVRIVPYRGYGNGTTAIISGRVLENRELRDPLVEDSWWRNVRSTYRAFATDEVAGCHVTGTYCGQTVVGVSNEEGYFGFRFDDTREVDTPSGWHPAEFHAETPRKDRPEKGSARAIGQILVPPSDSEFGIISDMDDTVIRSNVTNFWRIARLTVLKNARTRMPFEGVAAFYRALHAGSDGRRHNPIFYVSSSAWNLYDLFRVFLEHNEIPSGPILLRDFGLGPDKFVVELGHQHKLVKIRSILSMYPHLPFVLIGDSGQDDPKLYREAVSLFPGRVKAIYIRDVHLKTRDDVSLLSDAVTKQGVPMRLVKDTVEAAEHAASIGLIDAASVAEVSRDRAADHDPTNERQPVA